jgi:hypothetical protein
MGRLAGLQRARPGITGTLHGRRRLPEPSFVCRAGSGWLQRLFGADSAHSAPAPRRAPARDAQVQQLRQQLQGHVERGGSAGAGASGRGTGGGGGTNGFAAPPLARDSPSASNQPAQGAWTRPGAHPSGLIDPANPRYRAWCGEWPCLGLGSDTRVQQAGEAAIGIAVLAEGAARRHSSPTPF